MAAPIDRQSVADWLGVLQGDRTIEDTVADIQSVMAGSGWTIDRTRFGRYLGAKLPVGQKVVEHFNEYARKTRLPEYEARKPAAELPPIDLALRSIVAEVLESRAEREEMRREIDALKATVRRLLSGTLAPGGSGAPATPPSPQG